MLAILLFIFLLAIGLVARSARPAGIGTLCVPTLKHSAEGFITGSGLDQSAQQAETSSATGTVPAAPGIPNSVIPNAPFPPNVGIISNIQPVDNEVNFNELRDKIRKIEGSLPDEIKAHISTLTPTIVNGMIQARNCGYAQ